LNEINCDFIQIRKDYFSDINESTWFDTEVIPMAIESNNKYNIKVLGESYSELQLQLNYPQKCYAHYLQGNINATGDFYFCKNTRDNPKFALGNIYTDSLEDIWNKSLSNKELEKYITPMNCMTFCRNMGNNIAVENVKQNKLLIMKKSINKYFF
jgi:MoaA/NifB/PqqE/SkfB family radical SAM enzyme